MQPDQPSILCILSYLAVSKIDSHCDGLGQQPFRNVPRHVPNFLHYAVPLRMHYLERSILDSHQVREIYGLALHVALYLDFHQSENAVHCLFGVAELEDKHYFLRKAQIVDYYELHSIRYWLLHVFHIWVLRDEDGHHFYFHVMVGH